MNAPRWRLVPGVLAAAAWTATAALFVPIRLRYQNRIQLALMAFTKEQ